MKTSNPRTAVVLAGEIADDGTQWIEVMPVADKARNGRWYFTVTRDDLETYAAFVRENADRIPIDYDHEGQAGGSTRAAGWFTGQAEVEDTDEGPRLRALVKWTKAAAADIKDGAYRFISPEFSFHDRDAKTGLLTKAKELIAATLTNRPFFRELAPVGAADDVVWDGRYGLEQVRERLYAQLNPAAGQTFDYRYWVMDIALAGGRALVRENATGQTFVVPFDLADDGDVQVTSRAEWVEARQEWVAAASAALDANEGASRARKGTSMDPKQIRAALGLPEDADDAQVDAKLAEMTARAAKADELEQELETVKGAGNGEQATELEQVKADLAEERKLRLVAAREAALSDAIRDRKIVPAEKDALVEAFGGDDPAQDDLDRLGKVLAARPAAAAVHGGSGTGKTDPDTDAVAAEFRQGKDEERAVLPDEQSVTLVAKARELLAEAGKDPDAVTQDEFLAAMAKVGRELEGVAA